MWDRSFGFECTLPVPIFGSTKKTCREFLMCWLLAYELMCLNWCRGQAVDCRRTEETSESESPMQNWCNVSQVVYFNAAAAVSSDFLQLLAHKSVVSWADTGVPVCAGKAPEQGASTPCFNGECVAYDRHGSICIEFDSGRKEGERRAETGIGLLLISKG